MWILFVVYDYMMPSPIHSKIREEPIHTKKNFTKYAFNNFVVIIYPDDLYNYS